MAGPQLSALNYACASSIITADATVPAARRPARAQPSGNRCSNSSSGSLCGRSLTIAASPLDRSASLPTKRYSFPLFTEPMCASAHANSPVEGSRTDHEPRRPDRCKWPDQRQIGEVLTSAYLPSARPFQTSSSDGPHQSRVAGRHALLGDERSVRSGTALDAGLRGRRKPFATEVNDDDDDAARVGLGRSF
jgi:hypothetical protein